MGLPCAELPPPGREAAKAPNFSRAGLSKRAMVRRPISGLLAVGALLTACSGSPPRAVRSAPVAVASAAPPAPVAVLAASDLAEPRRSPFRLTAADGKDLAITSLSAKAEVVDPVATTELTLRFADDAAVEGRLALSLPEGAVVDRFALRRPTPAASVGPAIAEPRYDEATILDRPRRRASYDEVLAARTTADLGAAPFVAYVAPIAPKSSVEIVVRYHEVLSRGAYRLPLRGLPPLQLSARVDVAGGTAPLAEIASSGAAPEADLTIPEARYRAPAAGGANGVVAGDLMVVRMSVDGPTPTDALVSPIFLVDTSVSRALDLSEEIATLRDIASRLPSDAEITVAAYDQTVAPIYAGRAGALDAGALASIGARRALGASDLSGALAWVGRTALSSRGSHHRLVVLTGAPPSAGERDPGQLSKTARDLGAQGIDRADVVVFSGTAGAPAFRAITSDTSLPYRGTVVEAERGAVDVARRLTHAVLPPLDVAVEGARASSPAFASGVVAGSDVFVVAALAPGAKPLVRVGAKSVRPALRDVRASDVESLVGGAEIEALLASKDLAPADRRAAVIARSVARRTPSPFTGFTLPVDGPESSFARDVALEQAWRADDLELSDEPPPRGTEAFDPIDDRIQPSPHLGAVPSTSPVEKEPEAAPPAIEEPPPALTLRGHLPSEVVQRVVRLNHGRFRGCYERALGKRPKLEGRVVVKFEIDRSGIVASARDDGSEIGSPELLDCVVHEFLKLEFPHPLDEKVLVRYPLVFSRGDAPPPARHLVAVKRTAPPAPPREPEPHFDPPYDGRFGLVMGALAAGDRAGALASAKRYAVDAPVDVLAYLALGEAAEASGDDELAARAYGSIFALWSYRADLARVAGERLGRVGTDAALRIARDAFAAARAERPDQPLGHRLLAFAEYRAGRPEEAFRTLERALLDNVANDRFVGARPVLASDLGLLGAAWARTAPERRGEIERRTKGAGGRLESGPSLRAVLLWETNTTDVDLHVDDADGDHASRKKRALASGGELTSAIVDGYGPEAFVLAGERAARRYPYAFRVVLPARGSMGFAPGALQIVEHDGMGHLAFVDKPFVVMNGRPGIELGELAAPSP